MQFFGYFHFTRERHLQFAFLYAIFNNNNNDNKNKRRHKRLNYQLPDGPCCNVFYQGRNVVFPLQLQFLFVVRFYSRLNSTSCASNSITIHDYRPLRFRFRFLAFFILTFRFFDFDKSLNFIRGRFRSAAQVGNP